MIFKKMSVRVVKNLTPLSNDEFEWSTTDDDSLFSVDYQLPKCGWNLLEFSLAYDVSSASAHFYFDTGNGFNHEEKIVLPLRSGRVEKRLCYISTSIRSIRFDPLGSEGKFTIKHFRFKKLIPWVAYNRL